MKNEVTFNDFIPILVEAYEALGITEEEWNQMNE